jgi:hypothetical protein
MELVSDVSKTVSVSNIRGYVNSDAQTQSLLSAVTGQATEETVGEVQSSLVSCPNDHLTLPTFPHSFVNVTTKSRFCENKNNVQLHQTSRQPLMMEAQIVSETLDTNFIFTWLIT